MRLEKGYRAWGHELSPDDHLIDCGLGFTVDKGKKSGFLGKEAVDGWKKEESGMRVLQIV